MKRLLFIMPVALGTFLLGLLVVPESSKGLYHQVAVTLIMAWATLANVKAGLDFERGELLRRAWIANGASFACSALYDAAFQSGDAPFMYTVRVILVVLSNVTGILAIASFSGAYRAAGLDGGTTWKLRTGMTLGAVAVAAAAVGMPFVHLLAAVQGGDRETLIPAIAAGGDLVIFVCIVPIFFAALRLRGGLLAWPWSFFFASTIMWLVNDAQGAYAPDWADVWLVCAAALSVAAAMAQRRILRGAETPA